MSNGDSALKRAYPFTESQDGSGATPPPSLRTTDEEVCLGAVGHQVRVPSV